MLAETRDIETRDGAMETYICRPDRDGPFAPILLLMDAPGIREELRAMARRLASSGYLVLLPNLYYRAGRDTTYGPDVLTAGSAEHTRMRAVRTKMTIPPVMNDIADPTQIQAAQYFRRLVSLYMENRDLILMGGYAPGQDQDLDLAVQLWPKLMAHIQQPFDQSASYADSLKALTDLFNLQAGQ